MRPTAELTDYGFRFGACEVIRYTHRDDGSVVLGIETGGKHRLQIYVSPAGRSVRVFKHGVGELGVSEHRNGAA